MRKDPRERLTKMAEKVREAGDQGVSEVVLAWSFKIAASTMRTDYRRVLLEIFRDLRFDRGVYRVDPKVEADLVVADFLRSTSAVGAGR